MASSLPSPPMALLLSALLLSATALSKADVLLDTQGDMILNGGEYVLRSGPCNIHRRPIIPPVIYSAVGLAAANSSACPVKAVVGLFDMPVTVFISSRVSDLYLPPEVEVRLEFRGAPSCVVHPVWLQSVDADNPNGPSYVTVVGNDSDHRTIRRAGHFQVVKASNVDGCSNIYRLQSCQCDRPCRDVGIVDGPETGIFGARNYLTVGSGDDFLFVFEKPPGKCAY